MLGNYYQQFRRRKLVAQTFYRCTPRKSGERQRNCSTGTSACKRNCLTIHNRSPISAISGKTNSPNLRIFFPEDLNQADYETRRSALDDNAIPNECTSTRNQKRTNEITNMPTRLRVYKRDVFLPSLDPCEYLRIYSLFGLNLVAILWKR